MPGAAAAQDTAGESADADAAEYAELFALRERAEELVLGANQDAASRRETVQAWREVQAVAEGTPMSDGRAHPLAHVARIKIASQLYTLGENVEARAELEQGIAELEPDQAQYPASWAEGLALLGVLMTQDGDGDAAWPIVLSGYGKFLTSYETLESDGGTVAISMAKSNLEFSLSQIASRTGRTEESLTYQKTSLDTREATLGPNHPDTIASYYGYAGALRRADRVEEAEAIARLAVERAVAHVDPSHPSYARAFEMLGIVLSRSGRPIEATDYIVRALDLKREHEGTDNLVFGYGIHNLATILLQREKYSEAAPLFVEAEALFRAKQGENSPYAVGSLAYAAQIDFAEGRPRDAIERFEQLDARLGEESSDLDMRRRIAPDFARSLIATGAGERAQAIALAYRESVLQVPEPDLFQLRQANMLVSRAGIAVGEGPEQAVLDARAMLELLDRRGVATMRGNLPSEARASLDLVMEIAQLAGDADLMLSALALLNASDIGVATMQRAARLQQDDPSLAQVIRDLQDADARVEAADTALLTDLAAGQTRVEAREVLATANRQRDAILARLSAEFPGWLAQSNASGHPTIAGLRAQLADGEALLAVMPTYANGYVLLVDREGAVMSSIDAGRARLVSLARSAREDALTGRSDSTGARELSDMIFTPALRDRLAGTDTLKIVAGGALASLPFSLLEWPAGDGASVLMLNRFAIANISRFDLSYEGERRDGTLARFVGFAAPTPFRSTEDEATSVAQLRGITPFFSREGPDASALAQLPQLAGSQEEATQLAQLFSPDDAVIYLGDRASELMVGSRETADADVLLFSTHGLVAGEIEGIAEPALVLAPPFTEGPGDGLLTASEVAKLSLSADWVILSACDSGAGMRGGMPAFSGLAQAFRFAGAGALLVTHWPVRDDVATFISVETLRRARQGVPRAEALRQATLALIETSGLPDASNPAVWAPFVLIEN